MQAVFAFTLLLSATLLFLVQPMFAKMVLPLLGGAPAVWNTCMVFYQAVLLLGYLYAHFSTKLLGARRQAAFHLVVLFAPLIALSLPIAVRADLAPAAGGNPIPYLLALLAVSVGIPFFVVSASAPMLQTWFANTGHSSSKDPYFLYAASNLGSMLALVGYPAFFERYLPSTVQSYWWTMGFFALMVSTLACAGLLWKSSGRAAAAAPEPSPEPESEALAETLGIGTRLRWIALSFAPSSLLLGVTTFVTTDIASVPLLWIIPLAIYLLTFVLVFANWPTFLYRWAKRRGVQPAWLLAAFHPHWFLVWAQPFFVILLAVVFFQSAGDWMPLVVLLHLVVFFFTAMVCHGELARTRPSAKHLTEFYLWLSFGGVLGGLFNALVAPLIFDTVVEYPLVIAVACMLRPSLLKPRHPAIARWLDVTLPICGFAVLALLYHTSDAWGEKLAGLFTHNNAISVDSVEEYVILGIGGIVAFAFLARPVRFGMAVGMVLLAGQLWFSLNSNTTVVCACRSFFGVLHVDRFEGKSVKVAGRSTETEKLRLLHGSTNHGEQFLAPKKWQAIPITYYYPTGPIGQAFTDLLDPEKHQELGVIGLGTGSMAAYAKPGQRITFFEIDRDVVDISTSGRFFTYVPQAKSRGATVDIVLGDARLSLVDQPDGKFDILLVDAFSSDAIPVHLLTRESVELYFQKLKPDGVLLIHISNRHLDLAPVVGNLATDLNLFARECNDSDAGERSKGKFSSEVVILARDGKRLGDFVADAERWEVIPPDPQVGVWTDDFSNILTVLRWFRHGG
jgi:SAM-dependent methyltransferase